MKNKRKQKKEIKIFPSGEQMIKNLEKADFTKNERLLRYYAKIIDQDTSHPRNLEFNYIQKKSNTSQ